MDTRFNMGEHFFFFFLFRYILHKPQYSVQKGMLSTY